MHQVLQPGGVETVLGTQPAGLVGGRLESLSPQQRKLRRHRRPRLRQRLAQREIDGVLRHHPVGGELSARDGHHARNHLADGVLA